MTEVEKLELEKQEIENKLAEAKKRTTENSLRASFAALQDESVPVAKIIGEAVSRGRVPPDALAEFAERLAHLIKINTER